MQWYEHFFVKKAFCGIKDPVYDYKMLSCLNFSSSLGGHFRDMCRVFDSGNLCKKLLSLHCKTYGVHVHVHVISWMVFRQEQYLVWMLPCWTTLDNTATIYLIHIFAICMQWFFKNRSLCIYLLTHNRKNEFIQMSFAITCSKSQNLLWVDQGSCLKIQIQHILLTNNLSKTILPSFKSALLLLETCSADSQLHQEVQSALYTQLPMLEESFNDASFQVFL